MDVLGLSLLEISRVAVVVATSATGLSGMKAVTVAEGVMASSGKLHENDTSSEMASVSDSVSDFEENKYVKI